MDTTLILTKTAKGIQEAKTEHGDLNYDAVRLLRLVNGEATVGELRPQFSDLSDARFLKAMATLQNKGLVRALAGSVPAPGAPVDVPRADAQIQQLGQEILQTLDFTKLERNLLDAMRSPPSQPGAALPAAAPGRSGKGERGAAVRPSAEAVAKTQLDAETHEADMRAQLSATLRPHVEEESRASLTDTLRAQIAQDLRRQLVVALRPALEAEIRTKLMAALKPRVELELRAKLKEELAHGPLAPAQPARAGAAILALQHQRVLECMREAVFQTDLAGKTIYVNAAWTQFAGYSAGDANGKLLAELFIAEDQRTVATFLDGVVRGGATPPFVEANLARKKNTPRRVEVRAAPLTTVAGDIIGACGTLRSIGIV